MQRHSNQLTSPIYGVSDEDDFKEKQRRAVGRGAQLKGHLRFALGRPHWESDIPAKTPRK